jgi:hypothetical protein
MVKLYFPEKIKYSAANGWRDQPFRGTHSPPTFS